MSKIEAGAHQLAGKAMGGTAILVTHRIFDLAIRKKLPNEERKTDVGGELSTQGIGSKKCRKKNRKVPREIYSEKKGYRRAKGPLNQKEGEGFLLAFRRRAAKRRKTFARSGEKADVPAHKGGNGAS